MMKFLYGLQYLTLLVCILMPSSFFAATPGKKLLRVGYMNSLTQLPLITNYERHRFSFELVNVEMQNYHSFIALEAAFRVGAVDVAYLPLPIALQVKQDEPKIGIGESLHRARGGLLIKEDRWQKQWTNSLGVIGVLGLRAPGHFGFLHFMEQDGLEYGMGGQVRVVEAEDTTELFKKGLVTGLALPEPYLTRVLLHDDTGLIQKNYPSVPYVLLYRPELLSAEWKDPLREWVLEVRAACTFLAEDIGLYGGEQTIITQSRYLDYNQSLVRLVFLKNPSSLTFVSWFVQPDLIESTAARMYQLRLLSKPVHPDSLVDPVLTSVAAPEGGQK